MFCNAYDRYCIDNEKQLFNIETSVTNNLTDDN